MKEKEGSYRELLTEPSIIYYQSTDFTSKEGEPIIIQFGNDEIELIQGEGSIRVKREILVDFCRGLINHYRKEIKPLYE